MIYGHYTEGCRRECSNCGHFSSDFSYCWTCDMTICDGCDHTCIPADETGNWVEMPESKSAARENYGHQYNLFDEGVA